MIPLQRILELAAARAEHAAIVTSAEALTWRAFAEEVRNVTSHIAALSAERIIRVVAILSPNRIELPIVAAATATLRMTACGVDYSLDDAQIEELLDAIGADLLIVSSSFLAGRGTSIERLSAGRRVIDLDGRLRKAHAFAGMRTQLVEDVDLTPSRATAPAIGFTSGTTGTPKQVMRATSFDARRFAYFRARYGFGSSDRHLVAIPLYHAAGSGWARLFLDVGATIVIAPPDDPVAAGALISREWITTTTLTPHMLERIVDAIEHGVLRIAPHELRFVLVGGKLLSPSSKLKALSALGPVLYEYYGTTETGVNTIAEPNDLVSHPDSVGKAYDGNAIAIVGEDLQALPPDHIGHVAISSYMNMDDYVGSDARRTRIDGQAYIVTSERGYLDEERRLFLVSRARAGDGDVDFFPIENEIKKLPGIRDVALSPSPDRARQIDCALVAEDRTLTEDLQKRVKKIIETHRVRLRNIVTLNEIPYSPSGKVRSAEIARLTARAAIASPAQRTGGNRLLLGMALLAMTTIIWGGMFPVAKSALAVLDGFYLTLYRYGLASLVLLALLYLIEGRGSLSTQGRTRDLVLLGSSGFAGFSILMFLGLTQTQPENGAVIMALMPFIAGLIGWARTGARPAPVTQACIVAALLGVLLVVTKGEPGMLTDGSVLGDLSIALGACAWVVYTMGSASFPGWSALRYTALSAALGTVTITVLAAGATWLGFASPPSAAEVASVGWEIAYLVGPAAVLAVFSWNVGIKYLGAVNGVLFINLVPVTAFAIGLAQGRSFTGIEVTGAALTVAALVASNLWTRGLLPLPSPVKPVRAAAKG